MVLNIGELKAKEDDFVQKDIRAVVEAVQGKALTKVIIETALLTDVEKKRACQLAKAAQAGFVKTSTGFSGGGASVADIKLMRDRKSTRLNSSHVAMSYAVFCLHKKTPNTT